MKKKRVGHGHFKKRCAMISFNKKKMMCNGHAQALSFFPFSFSKPCPSHHFSFTLEHATLCRATQPLVPLREPLTPPSPPFAANPTLCPVTNLYPLLPLLCNHHLPSHQQHVRDIFVAHQPIFTFF